MPKYLLDDLPAEVRTMIWKELLSEEVCECKFTPRSRQSIHGQFRVETPWSGAMRANKQMTNEIQHILNQTVTDIKLFSIAYVLGKGRKRLVESSQRFKAVLDKSVPLRHNRQELRFVVLRATSKKKWTATYWSWFCDVNRSSKELRMLPTGLLPMWDNDWMKFQRWIAGTYEAQRAWIAEKLGMKSSE